MFVCVSDGLSTLISSPCASSCQAVPVSGALCHFRPSPLCQCLTLGFLFCASASPLWAFFFVPVPHHLGLSFLCQFLTTSGLLLCARASAT